MRGPNPSSVKRSLVARVPWSVRHALYRIYRQLYWVARRAVTRVTGQGWPPGHHYSPLVDIRYVRRHSARLFNPQVELGSSIDLNTAVQDETLAAVAAFYEEFDWPEEPAPDRRYYLNNRLFIYGDAACCTASCAGSALAVMSRHRFSSALMLDPWNVIQPETELVFIEPFSARC
jgi:hypothetical protein